MKYMTEQRKLLQTFFMQHPHELFSAKEIAESLEKAKISVSAVYRSLSDLEQDGLISRRAKSGSRGFFYQYTGAADCREHIHLTCKKCGKTVHITSEDTEVLTQKVSQYKHFLLDKEETILYGTCETCQRA